MQFQGTACRVLILVVMDNSLVHTTVKDWMEGIAVLILVVMDNSLVQVGLVPVSVTDDVLILVVMDNSLVRRNYWVNSKKYESVLILVVMDNSLVLSLTSMLMETFLS